mgnify:CR=1 FL=1
MKIDPPSTRRRCSSASDSWSETSPLTLNRAVMQFLSTFWRFRAILSRFQRHLSDFERQMRLVGTTSPIGSLNIESIFASPGPARTQHPASSTLKIGIFIGIDQPSNDWRNRWNNFGGPYRVIVGYLNCVYRSVLREEYTSNLVAP